MCQRGTQGKDAELHSTTVGPVNGVPGVNPANLRRWFDKRVDGFGDDPTFEQIQGGHSNLTFTVRDGSGRRWVLRRPPLGHVLATAHDMVREHRVISALADSGVPVPAVVGLCEDITVNGAPFYVMEFVDGIVVRDVATAATLPIRVRERMGRSLVEVLGRLHSVDVDTVGLGDLGRRDGYIERQLKRWRAQFEQSATREVPRVLEVHETLVARIPPQQGVGIVHGDYRIDNTIMTGDGEIAAVLDWELCTLGDVLSDVAAIVAYADERASGGQPLPMSLEGFPSAEEVRSLYAAGSERDLSRLDFYLAFNYWRLACIVEGVYSRYAAGVMGDDVDPATVSAFGDRVLVMADLAAEAAARVGGSR